MQHSLVALSLACRSFEPLFELRKNFKFQRYGSVRFITCRLLAYLVDIYGCFDVAVDSHIITNLATGECLVVERCGSVRTAVYR
jgi:hypothetical protein